MDQRLLQIVGALTAPHSHGTDVPVDGAVHSINSGRLCVDHFKSTVTLLIVPVNGNGDL